MRGGRFGPYQASVCNPGTWTKLRVPGCERKIELAGRGGDPNVVIRDQLAHAGEFRRSFQSRGEIGMGSEVRDDPFQLVGFFRRKCAGRASEHRLTLFLADPLESVDEVGGNFQLGRWQRLQVLDDVFERAHSL